MSDINKNATANPFIAGVVNFGHTVVGALKPVTDNRQKAMTLQNKKVITPRQ